MGLKEIIKDTFKNNNELTIERYKSAKTTLVFISFFFIVNFYFVWAWFFPEYFNKSLSFLYLLLLFSFVFYFYFLFKKLLINNEKNYFNIIIFIIFIILLWIFWFLSLPVVLDGWFNWILKIINLYS